jgi:hypothetical protein
MRPGSAITVQSFSYCQGLRLSVGMLVEMETQLAVSGSHWSCVVSGRFGPGGVVPMSRRGRFNGFEANWNVSLRTACQGGDRCHYGIPYTH